MSYTTETYDKAQSILDRRKERATLEAQERIDEIAQMLSGADITEAARHNAKELLKQCTD